MSRSVGGVFEKKKKTFYVSRRPNINHSPEREERLDTSLYRDQSRIYGRLIIVDTASQKRCQRSIAKHKFNFRVA